MPLPDPFVNPPRECSVAPFWFWNDQLDDAEIVRQIDNFAAHGVYAFVIHPRVGLPRDCGWMSDRLLGHMRTAIEHAAANDLWVILYDEGMYPSGSSAGQVAAANPAYACRGLVKLDGRVEQLPDGANLVAHAQRANGEPVTIVDQPIGSVIRGLHYLDHDPPVRGEDWPQRRAHETKPLAGDLLNPEAMACFIRLVYQRYYDEFGEHFGKTIRAIFTDEPKLTGHGDRFDARPGTTGILEHVNAYLGYDFTPHLPALWFDDEPNASARRADYDRAIQHRLEQTYYQPISEWCAAHDVALTGHPWASDAIGHERYFQWPGQDIVWRCTEPGEKAVAGGPATMARCAASAMKHLGRRRNANEFMGAYGAETTLEEYRWVADWLLVRGCNLLIPHAFFYSVDWPRGEECPPQLGPHAKWWPQSKPLHEWMARMCWLNTDSEQACDVAVLALADRCPWEAGVVLQQSQIDFNYLEARHLWEDATVDSAGVHLAGMTYRAVIVDGITPPDRALPALRGLADAGRVIAFRPASLRLDPPGAAVTTNANELLAAVDGLVERDVVCEPRCEALRVRHVRKAGDDWYLLHNENADPIDTAIRLGAAGRRYGIDPVTCSEAPLGEMVRLVMPGHASAVIRVTKDEA